MKLQCVYEISGTGTLTLEVSELDDLTPEAAEAWLTEGARIEVVEQGNYHVTLRPRYGAKQLSEALAAEKLRRENEE